MITYKICYVIERDEMIKFCSKLGVVLVLSLVWVNPAFAYLDPGTGSIILQAIIGSLAAAGVAFATARQQISDFITRLFGRKANDDDEKS